jgi:hypothetical protein
MLETIPTDELKVEPKPIMVSRTIEGELPPAWVKNWPRCEREPSAGRTAASPGFFIGETLEPAEKGGSG